MHEIELLGQYWNDYMYCEKIFQWETHFGLKLEHLQEVLNQFIKITESARGKKLHPSTISKA